MNILSETRPKAKKQHRCDFCRGIIDIGEKYIKQSYVDGDFYMWKSHLQCMDIAHKLGMFEDSEEGVTSSDFSDFVTEAYKDLPKEIKPLERPLFSIRLKLVIEHLLTKTTDQ